MSSCVEEQAFPPPASPQLLQCYNLFITPLVKHAAATHESCEDRF